MAEVSELGLYPLYKYVALQKGKDVAILCLKKSDALRWAIMFAHLLYAYTGVCFAAVSEVPS